MERITELFSRERALEVMFFSASEPETVDVHSSRKIGKKKCIYAAGLGDPPISRHTCIFRNDIYYLNHQNPSCLLYRNVFNSIPGNVVLVVKA